MRNYMARSKIYYEKYSMPPLKIQYKAGYEAFKSRRQWTRKSRRGATIIITANPYPKETMQYKEWERGYSRAYFDKLKEWETIR
jgi:hypothetical protein|tara:strand:+ start:487 stop:738 length:252 start_codon:yes stop_codon:yes gene_type:complete